MSALQATSAGVKDMADGSLRITLEFDPRYAKDAFALFGSRGTPVAIARLTQEAAQEHAQKETVADSEPKGGFLSQWLAMRENEPEFWLFIESKINNAVSINDVGTCDEVVKRLLGIISKREIDNYKEVEARFHSMIRLPYADWLRGVR